MRRETSQLLRRLDAFEGREADGATATLCALAHLCCTDTDPASPDHGCARAAAVRELLAAPGALAAVARAAARRGGAGGPGAAGAPFGLLAMMVRESEDARRAALADGGLVRALVRAAGPAAAASAAAGALRGVGPAAYMGFLLSALGVPAAGALVDAAAAVPGGAAGLAALLDAAATADKLPWWAPQRDRNPLLHAARRCLLAAWALYPARGALLQASKEPSALPAAPRRRCRARRAPPELIPLPFPMPPGSQGHRSRAAPAPAAGRPHCRGRQRRGRAGPRGR